MSNERLSREQREQLRGQVDQARREAQRPSDVRPPTDLQQKTAHEIEALLPSKPGQLVSLTEIGQALGYNLERVKRALALLERQRRVKPIQVGRYTRWKAPGAEDPDPSPTS